jgi:tRNA-specific 2-thiouridylase
LSGLPSRSPDFSCEENTRPSRVVVALSGGGDSALAAALLKDRGWEVTGLHFLFPASSEKKEARALSVQRVAERLRIGVSFMDLTEAFTREVVEPFVAAYLTGLTPNPCVVCNEAVKFEHLLRYGEERHIPMLSTGHYATVRRRKGPVTELWRGSDREKEQSYFLHRLTQRHLSRTLLPLGQMTKKEAKQLALQLDLPTSSEPESQEICFLPEDDYRVFFEDRKGKNLSHRGEIVDGEGRMVGEHHGTYRYTIGQRHGLGIASSRPYYVKEIRPERNEIVVGRKEDLLSSRVEAEGFNWIGGMPAEKRTRLLAQIRYRHHPAPGWLQVLTAQTARFDFDVPQWAITPGQALVCYDGERLVGGGWIRKSHEHRA